MKKRITGVNICLNKVWYSIVMAIRGTYTYFGIKGGGLHFSQSLSFLTDNMDFLLSSKNQGLYSYSGNTETIQGVPSGIRENIFFFNRKRQSLATEILSKIPELAVSAMQHPIDNTILELAIRGPRILSVIHDAEPHDHDFWPRKKDIQKRAELSHTVISLSSYSATKIYKDYGVKSICMPLLGPKIDVAFRKTNKIYDVSFLGRRNKYKGAADLHRILERIDRPLRVVTNILSEKDISRIHQQTNHRVFLLSKWINDFDMFEALAASKVLILPYRTASQSGWVPIARDLKLPIVATNVGGLSEQFQDGRDGILVPKEDSKSFASAMVRATNEDWLEIEDMTSARTKWIQFIQSITL
jgi:glycosyltransferase involved in cell wall biosynthesis